MPSLAVMNNFKKSVELPQLASDIAWGASAALPYSFVPSILAKVTNSKFDGWKGWFTAVFSTWALGAAFDIPQWRSGAWTLGTQHLIYAYDVLGKVNLPMWRFDDGSIGGARVREDAGKPNTLPTSRREFSALPQGADNRGYGVGDDSIQPGAILSTMPDGSQLVVYPDSDPEGMQEPMQTNGMNDYFETGQPAPQMRSLEAVDLYATM